MRRSVGRRAGVLAVTVGAVLVVPAAAGAAADGASAAVPAAAGDAGATRVLAFADPRIDESSSLVASRRHPGILWTANDSGDVARIFAVAGDGRTVAAYRLDVVPARDWEAMAPTVDAKGRPALLVGDIGDNTATRDRGILLHLVTEPASLDPADVRPLPATSYRLVYDDGPHDAEGLAVDPRNGQVFVVTKGLFGGSVYAAPRPLDPKGRNVLTRVGSAPSLVTDAACLADGRLVVRDYAAAEVLARDFTVTDRVDLPAQLQGESLALTPDGTAMLVGSEGLHSDVWRLPVPVAARVGPSPAGSDPGTAASVPAARRGVRGSGSRVAGLVTGPLVALGGLGVVALGALGFVALGALGVVALGTRGVVGALVRRRRRR